jgi:hypothetical protein
VDGTWRIEFDGENNLITIEQFSVIFNGEFKFKVVVWDIGAESAKLFYIPVTLSLFPGDIDR